jgi:hypothetical protein
VAHDQRDQCAARPPSVRRALTRGRLLAEEKSCLTTRSALNQGKIWLAPDFFSLSLGVEPAKRRIRDELCRFSVLTNPPKTPFGESKRTYSGKVAGMQDDVAVTMQIALEACVQFYSDDKYRDLAYHR